MKITKKGFSGIKVITILAVTSLWISISIPTLVHFNIEANQAQALNQMQRLTEACEKFKTQHGKYPHSINALAEFFKDDLSSPGYHFQYEFLNEGSFVLVGIPNNNLSGNGSFYSDDGLSVIEVPPGLKASNPGIVDGSSGRLARLRELVKGGTKVSSSVLPGGHKDLVKVGTPDSTLVIKEIENTNVGPAKINQENLVMAKPERIPEVRIREFESLVYELERLSLSPPDTVALANYETKTIAGLRVEKTQDQDFSPLGNYHDTSTTVTSVSVPTPEEPVAKPKPKPEPSHGTDGGRR